MLGCALATIRSKPVGAGVSAAATGADADPATVARRMAAARAQLERIHHTRVQVVEDHGRGVVREAEEAMEEDKLFVAFEKLQVLRSTYTILIDDSAKHDVAEHADRARAQLERSSLYRLVCERVSETRRLLAEFESEAGWTTIRETDDGARTDYREEIGHATHSFRCSTTTHAPLLNAVAVLNELDLYTDWFPFLKHAKELRAVSRFCKIIQLELYAPWPLQNRDVVCLARAVNVLETNRVVVFLRSITHHPNTRIPPPAPGVCRADISLGGFLFEPLTAESSRAHLLINVDPKLDSLPYSLLNWFVGKLLHILLGRIEGAARFDSSRRNTEYGRRMHGNPELYEYVSSMLKAYFRQKEAALLNNV